MGAVTIDSLEIKLQTNGTKGSRAVNGLSSSMDRLGKSSGNATLSFAKLVSKISVATMAVKRIGTALGGCIKEVSNYTENINLFNVSMGQYAEEAGAYARKVESALGIDISEFARNQGVFMTLATGFGVAGDRAYTMSQQLTQLGYDISSFYNIDVADAMQKLQSGISGELEPLRRLGYDLSQAKLEATALELGITKNVKAMTQAEKAQLRYHAIMTQVTQSHGDMARTIESPANQIRILGAQFTRTSRAIGGIFIPALTAVLPYVNAVMRVVEQLATAIAGLFGYEAPEFKNFDNAAAGASDIADGLDDATSAAKKLKSYTMGFDELNVIDPNSGSSGNDAGGGGWTDFDLTTYDFLGDATGNKITGIVDNIKEKFREVIVVTDELQNALDSIGTETEIPISVGMVVESVVLTAQNIYFKLMDYLNGLLYDTNWKSIGKTIGTILGKAITSIDFSGIVNKLQRFRLGIITAILDLLSGAIDGIDWGNLLDHFVTEITEFIIGIGDLDWGKFGKSLANVFDSLFVAIKEVDWEKLGVDLANLIPTAFGAIKTAIDKVDWVELASKMFKALGGAIAGLVKAAWNIAKTLWEMILDAWDSVKEHFAESIEECGGHVVGGILCGIIDGLINIGKWLYDNVLTPFLDGFKEVFGIHSPSTVMAEMGVFLIEGLLQGIKNTWGDIKSFLSEKWEEIKAGMSETWESIKSTASEKWDNLKSICSEKFGNIRDKISEKWSEIKTNTSEKWESIKSTCSEKWADIKEDATAVFGDLKEGVVGIWESIWTNIKNTINCIIGGIEGLANGVVKGVNFIFKALNKVQVDVPDWVTDLTGITTFGFNFGMLKEVKIPRLMADGGFVDTGELFIAREAGAEMVGSIGRKTAVANNDQIVQGIATGVADANAESNALLREQNALLRAMVDKESGVYLDGRKLSKELDRVNRGKGVRIIAGGAY